MDLNGLGRIGYWIDFMGIWNKKKGYVGVFDWAG